MQSHALSKGIVKKKRTKNYLLLFLFLLEASLGYSQNVTLHLKDESIEKAFRAIESQTGYNFIYSTETIRNAKPVTVDLAAVSIDEALVRLFSGQPLHFAIEDHQVIVKREEKTNDNPVSDVAGRVVDESGNPLQGASISVKGSTKGTNTDASGKFTLRKISSDAVLTCSMVGYQSIEIPLNGRTSLLIRMSISVTALDETIIKGYYNTSRLLNTGSVDKVKGADIERQPVSNILGALEGRVPGLLLTQKSGLPGAGFSVEIRGQNSIQNGNSPLYVIDGVPFLNDADLLTQRSQINASSPFSTINPEDIESIEILKDADATAIYGSRGANGVILITTKKAKGNKTGIDLNYYSSWSRISHTMPLMNTPQYLMMRHEAFLNDNIVPTPSNAYDFLVWDSSRYTDLKKVLIGGTAHTDNLNATLSGGNEKTHFSLGTNYYSETTVFPGSSKDQRGSVNLSLNHATADKKFSINMTSSYSSDKSNLISQDLTQFINLAPTIPALYDSLGGLNWSKGGYSFNNPLSNTLRSYNVLANRLTASTQLNYAISSRFNVKTNLGYNEVSSEETSLIPIASQDPGQTPTGSAFFGDSRFANWIVEPQAEYSNAFLKKLKLQALIGASWQQNRIDRSFINGTGYVNDEMLGATAGAQTLTSKNSFALYRYNSGFGRINLNFLDKYLVNLTGRRDGSSRFGPGRQFANFGAAGIAWIFTKVKWIKGTLPFLSYGKLRGSYGITGNDLIGNYQYLDTYVQTPQPYQGGTSLIPGKLYNPDYSWEQIRKLDLALELSFLNQRLSITVDRFYNSSENQIISYSLPAQTGFSSVLRNFPGVVVNEGIECSIGSTNISSRVFSWKTTLQLSLQKNELKQFPGLEASAYATQYKIGKSLNSRLGYVYAGVDPQTGVYQFLDHNKVLTFTPNTLDYAYLGNTDPACYGGFENSIRFKDLQLDFLFEFRKQKGIDPIYGHIDGAGGSINEPVLVVDRWQKPGDAAAYQRYTQTFGPAGSSVFYVFNSSASLTDASFVRLKNLSISYALPSSALKRAGMKQARVYLEGQNLLLFTKYKGPDPETQSFYNLPPLKTLAVGIQLNF